MGNSIGGLLTLMTAEARGPEHVKGAWGRCPYDNKRGMTDTHKHPSSTLHTHIYANTGAVLFNCAGGLTSFR